MSVLKIPRGCTVHSKHWILPPSFERKTIAVNSTGTLRETGFSWIDSSITLYPTQAIPLEDTSHQQLLNNISEQIYTVQNKGTEIHQLTGMNTKRLKHLSDRVMDELYWESQTPAKEITVYTVLAVITTIIAAFLCLVVAKYQAAMLEINKLKERMLQHEQIVLEDIPSLSFTGEEATAPPAVV